MTTTAPQTPDRAAIEDLARELTDDEWGAVISNNVHPEQVQRIRATAPLLAYLDEVWAGLTPDARVCLERFGDGLEVPGPLRRTALGRAVLKRAKDTRRA